VRVRVVRPRRPALDRRAVRSQLLPIAGTQAPA
jgi:hypothetical protein